MTTRLAYAEIHADETAATCAGFLHRAASFFAQQGIPRIERVMTDNAFSDRHARAGRAGALAGLRRRSTSFTSSLTRSSATASTKHTSH